MGIRYYAYPVPGNRVDDARREPGLFLGADPLADAWRLEPVTLEDENGQALRGGRAFVTNADKPRPTMLYLDKAFRVFQDLFSNVDDGPGLRDSYALVEGKPTTSFAGGYSFTPWVRVLDPASTAAIALDLEQVDPVPDDHPALTRGLDWEARTINEYLDSARAFMADRAAEGDGVVYTIT